MESAPLAMSSSCSADEARHGEAVRSLATSCSSVATLATADVLGVFHCAQLLSAAECHKLAVRFFLFQRLVSQLTFDRRLAEAPQRSIPSTRS